VAALFDDDVYTALNRYPDSNCPRRPRCANYHVVARFFTEDAGHGTMRGFPSIIPLVNNNGSQPNPSLSKQRSLQIHRARILGLLKSEGVGSSTNSSAARFEAIFDRLHAMSNFLPHRTKNFLHCIDGGDIRRDGQRGGW
jgi:hypothetical protein